MIETWRYIPGFLDHYQISNLGRVKSLPFYQRYRLRNGEWSRRKTRERIMSAQIINSGYLVVHLYKNGRRTPRLVHRLVAESFLIGNGPVNHLDGDKTHNAASNLEYTTDSENKRHAVKIGLQSQAVPVIGTSIATGASHQFASCAEAAFSLTGKRSSSSSIYRVLKGSRQSAFGYTWERAK